jgi:hypothetical protein
MFSAPLALTPGETVRRDPFVWIELRGQPTASSA